jgi:hypothetical protein
MTAKANMHSNNSCFSSIGVKDLEKKVEKWVLSSVLKRRQQKWNLCAKKYSSSEAFGI